MSILQSFRNLFRKQQEEFKLQTADFTGGVRVESNSLSSTFKKNYSDNKSTKDEGISGGVVFGAELMLGSLTDKESPIYPVSLEVNAGYDMMTNLARINGLVNYNVDVESSKREEGVHFKSFGIGSGIELNYSEYDLKKNTKDLVEFWRDAATSTRKDQEDDFKKLVASKLTVNNMFTGAKHSASLNDQKTEVTANAGSDYSQKDLVNDLIKSDANMQKIVDGYAPNFDTVTAKDVKALAAYKKVGGDTTLFEMTFISEVDANNVTKLSYTVTQGSDLSPVQVQVKSGTVGSNCTVVVTEKAREEIYNAYKSALSTSVQASSMLDDLDKVEDGSNSVDKKDAKSLSTIITTSSYSHIVNAKCDTLNGRLNYNQAVVQDSMVNTVLYYAVVNFSFTNVFSGNCFQLDIRNEKTSLVAQLAYKIYSVQAA